MEILLSLSGKYKITQLGHRSAIVKQRRSILSSANIPCTPIYDIRDTIIYSIKNHDAPCLSEAIYYCKPLQTRSVIFYHRNDMLIYANLFQC